MEPNKSGEDLIHVVVFCVFVSRTMADTHYPRSCFIICVSAALLLILLGQGRSEQFLISVWSGLLNQSCVSSVKALKVSRIVLVLIVPLSLLYYICSTHAIIMTV